MASTIQQGSAKRGDRHGERDPDREDLDSGGPYGEEGTDGEDGAPPRWVQWWAEEHRRMAEENRRLASAVSTLADKLAEARVTTDPHNPAMPHHFKPAKIDQAPPQERRCLAQERPEENLWPWMEQEQPMEWFAGTSTMVSTHCNAEEGPEDPFQQRLEAMRLAVGEPECCKGKKKCQRDVGDEEDGRMDQGPPHCMHQVDVRFERGLDALYLQPRAEARPMTFEQWVDSLVPRSTGVTQQAVETLPPEEDTYQEGQRGSKGRGKGRKKQGKKKRGPLKEAVETQPKEGGAELQWQLEEDHKQELDALRTSLVYLHQQDLQVVEEENARLKDVGALEEARFKKELKQVKRVLQQKHADELKQARKEVQELEQARKVEAEEWKSKWEVFTRKSEEKLSLVCKDLENKVEVEKQVSQKLQEQQAVRVEGFKKSLEEQQNRVQKLEALVKQLEEQSQRDLAVTESSFRDALKDKELEVEQLSSQVKSLQTQLEKTTRQWKSLLVASAGKIKHLVSEREQVQAELAAEKASKAALEVQLRKVSNEPQVEVSGPRKEMARAQEFGGEKEQELEVVWLQVVSHIREPKDLQRSIRKLEGELTQSGEVASGVEEELTSRQALVRGKGKPVGGRRGKMAWSLQGGRGETGLVRSLEQAMFIMFQRLRVNEAEGNDPGQLALAESKELKKRQQLLQSRRAMAVSWADGRYLTRQAKDYHELAIVKSQRGLSWMDSDFLFQRGRSSSSALKKAAVPLLLGGVCHRGRPPERLDPCVSTHQDSGQQEWPDCGPMWPLGVFVGVFVGWRGRVESIRSGWGSTVRPRPGWSTVRPSLSGSRREVVVGECASYSA